MKAPCLDTSLHERKLFSKKTPGKIRGTQGMLVVAWKYVIELVRSYESGNIGRKRASASGKIEISAIELSNNTDLPTTELFLRF